MALWVGCALLLVGGGGALLWVRLADGPTLPSKRKASSATQHTTHSGHAVESQDQEADKAPNPLLEAQQRVLESGTAPAPAGSTAPLSTGTNEP